jgi:chemosensory pili system protein ChpA (sensor histidine kinase/response regulator)
VIAVVEDHADTAAVLVRLLVRSGLGAKAFNCGPELFEALQAGERPALILLDVQMPEMDGLECLNAIRSHAQWQTIPVVIFSASFEDKLFQQAMSLGARAYVVKGTVSFGKLLDVIRAHAVN